MRIVMLAGGVGGARMAVGLSRLDEIELTVVVNVADDDQIHGLYVSPDLDTVVYTLAGMQGPQGWGRSGETWTVMEELSRFPIDTSFRLGDRDLATNLFRTHRRLEGARLSEITGEICQALDVDTTVLPATDDLLRTRVQVAASGEWLDFQTYFVRRRHVDRIQRVEWVGAPAARPAPGVMEAIAGADAVVVAPSNPVLSIRPILEVADIGSALQTARRVLAVSPLIGGEALKGPAAEVLDALGYPPGNRGVAAAYDGLLTDLVIDSADPAEGLDAVRVWQTDIRIPDADSSLRLAKEIVSWL